MRARRISPAVAGICVAAGCAAAVAGCRNWDDFNRLESLAPVSRVHIDTPGERFGQVLVGYEVPVLRDTFVRGTRLYVGGESVRSEPQATYAVFRIWDEVRPAAVAGTTPRLEVQLEVDRGDSDVVTPAIRGCHAEDRDMGSTIVNCGSGRRAGAGFPYLHTATGTDWWGCVAVTAGEVSLRERVQIRCESIGPQMSLLLDVESGLGWGASAAGVPIEHPFGVAVFGAPLTDGRGAIFRLRHLVDQQMGLGMGQPDGGSRRGLIPITGLELEDGAMFGRSVALGVDRTGGAQTIRIAATFGEDTRRVVVAEVTAADGTSVSAEVIGCLAGGSDAVGFGDALAWGDFDGDGHPDLAIGPQPRDGLPLDLPVAIFDGESFGGASTCSLATPSSARPTAEFGCLASARGTNVDCVNSRFGHALAAGDFDGDGLDDLAVGAPGVGTARAAAGVVQTIAGEARLADMGRDAMRRGTLFVPNANESTAFGVAVAAIPAPFGRAEIGVSQANPPQTRVFYCSDLAGDTPESVGMATGVVVRRGCGVAPERLESTQLDPDTVPDGMMMPSPDAGVGPDAGSSPDAGVGADAGP